ncbi:MAG: hypothetical protein BWY71_02257 [Planctomycetes bacterium ADurb.Bin412]|nr:MAG: hypothetical protein BWY71_02257 [Planctomycetes bacterium ADurb.Bin412]
MPLAVHNGAIDGSGAAVLGQQRAMQVNHATGRHIEVLGADFLAEGNDQQNVGVEGGNMANERRLIDVGGFPAGKLKLSGKLGNGSRQYFFPAAGRPGRLGDDLQQLV